MKKHLVELALLSRVANSKSPCIAFPGERTAAVRLWRRGLLSRNDHGIKNNRDAEYTLGDGAQDVIDRLLDVLAGNRRYNELLELADCACERIEPPEDCDCYGCQNRDAYSKRTEAEARRRR